MCTETKLHKKRKPGLWTKTSGGFQLPPLAELMALNVSSTLLKASPQHSSLHLLDLTFHRLSAARGSRKGEGRRAEAEPD